MFFMCFIFSACTQKANIDITKYKFQCSKNNETACAKYLFLESWTNAKEESFTTNLDRQNWDYWKDRYLNKIETKEDAFVVIETMLSSLDDPYTRFLTPKEVEEQNMQISAELTGIGVVISSASGKITIEDVLENSPALKNDLRKGDVIIKINNNSVSGFDISKIAQMIRGPIGTEVTLDILREGATLRKKIIRDKITIKAVTSKMLENNIAYIKISTFMSNSAAIEFMKEIKKLENANSLVIDLRGNQGGLLQNAIFIANILLQEGKIVSIHQKNNNTETINVESSGFHINKPLVVLTNGLSASAGEILAAALQENDRAFLVGEKTYGKGLIQRIMPLPLNTAMNVTIAKYLTPDGHDINKNGIKPDYEVKLTLDDFQKGKDPQLAKAIELLK